MSFLLPLPARKQKVKWKWRASGSQFQTWIETESKEIRSFMPALQHSLQLPFETRNMYSCVLLHTFCPAPFWKEKEEHFCRGLYMLSDAEHPLPRLFQLNHPSKHPTFLPVSHITVSNNHRIHLWSLSDNEVWWYLYNRIWQEEWNCQVYPLHRHTPAKKCAQFIQ